MRKTQLAILFAAAIVAGSTTTAQADDVQAVTTVSGLMFFDFTDIGTTQDDSIKSPVSTDVDPNGPGIDVKRFYIGVNHLFDQTWSVQFTSDFNYSSTTGETQMFVKKAYLQGKFNDWALLSLGSNSQPWAPFVEGIYGYRFVENTFTDREKLANTADWGAHLTGNNDAFSYDVAVVNGGGYKNPSRSKAVDEEARVSYMPVGGLTFALGYYTGELGQDTELAETTNAGKSKNTASRFDLLAAWKANGLTIGGEYAHAKNFSTTLIFNNITDTQAGYSLFGSYDFTPEYSVFARYDDYKPNKDTNASIEDKYYNAGFAWKSNSSITWALVYKGDKLEDNLKRVADNNALKTSEIGLWAQVKF